MRQPRTRALFAALVVGCTIGASTGSAASATPGVTAETDAAAWPRTRIAAPPQSIAPFELTGMDGGAFRSDELRGDISLVFFGFTNCDQVCPATLQVLRQVRRSLETTPDAPNIVFISVDGDRDTPAAIRKYMEPFGTGFGALTGDPKLVRDIAAGFSAVFFKGAPAGASGGYQVEHTSQVYLLDRSGKLRATFYGATAAEIESVVRHVTTDAKTSG